jgi:hypothetical protein
LSDLIDNSAHGKTLRAEFLNYLSGKMPEAERDAFETRLLAEQDLSDAVAMLEYELLDELAAGTLREDERRTVADWAQGSEARRRRVAVSGLLRQRKIAQSRRPGWKAAGFLLMAASLAVAVVLVVWRQESALHRPNGGQSTSQTVQTASAAPAPVRPDTILLVAERLRGTEEAPVVYRLHRDTPLRVQVIVPPSSEDQSYSLKISRVGDRQFVLERDKVTPTVVGGLRFVDVLFPANALDAGSYVAVLRAGSGAWTSKFSVAWKTDGRSR